MKKIMWKMVWNQRKSIVGILIEQIFIIFVLMICTVSLCSLLNKYSAPGMLDTTNQYVLMIMPTQNASQKTREKIIMNLPVIVRNLRTAPCVEDASVSSYLIPYLRTADYYFKDSISIKDKKVLAHLKWADKSALSTFGIQLQEGSWFTDDKQTLPDGSCPAIVSRQLLENADFPIAVGDKFLYRNQENTIIGIIAGAKEEAFETSSPVVIIPINKQIDLKFGIGGDECIIKIKKGNEKEFYESAQKEFNKIDFNNEAELIISDIRFTQSSDSHDERLQIATQSLPAIFLFIFAFIGTSALFWIRSRKKMKELALQIALGATPNELMMNIILESIAVTLLASLPSLIIAFFIYDFTIVHLIAIGTTIIVMLLFAVFSAWYPAYKVSRINPAEVLHYE